MIFKTRDTAILSLFIIHIYGIARMKEQQFRLMRVFLLQAGLHGLTGHIEFNEGKRTNFKLDLLKLKKEELVKVGEWKPGSGINVTDMDAFYETTATNITLVVMTREVMTPCTQISRVCDPHMRSN